ncbi:MAG: ATP-binding cassette domain-containing protein [Actinomycetota bacterium]
MSTGVAKPFAGAALTIATYAVAASVLPSGLPLGVVVLGVVLGSLQALTAVGLVLIYRASRAISFAQAEIGGLASAMAVIMVTGSGLPYLVAVPIGLAVALATGALIDLVVIRRLFTAPRLIVTVATLGVAQLLGAAQIALPTVFTDLGAFETFSAPLDVTFGIGPVTFDGNDVIVGAVVPIVCVALWWFLGRSHIGIAIRGAADSSERASLLGIPVRRLSTVTWIVAAGLSGIGALLQTPITGVNVGVISGPTALVVPLAAAVIARMQSVAVAFCAAVGISVVQQAIFWSYPSAAAVDVALFVVVLGALLLQRRGRRTVGDDLGGHVAVEEVRPLAPDIARRTAVRASKIAVPVVAAGVLVLVAFTVPDPQLTLLADMAVYGIVAVSLVTLVGWAGQISLGQFAFVGIGAAATASILTHYEADLFVALVVSMIAGGVGAILVGLPALRISGPFLAVATLAFAVPVSSYLLSARYFPALVPPTLDRPSLFDGAIDLDPPRTFFAFSIAVLAVAIVIAHNYRRSRAGRIALAVRDNERAAAAYGISPTRARLIAFGLSGVLAGLAGGVLVVALRGVGFGSYSPAHSISSFTMVVVGGLGSIPGALLGAVYVKGAEYFLQGAVQLLATGAGLLALLLVVPGGLGSLLYRARDATVRLLWGGSVSPARDVNPAPAPRTHRVARRSNGSTPALRIEGIDAGYGRVQVLHGVDIDVGDGDIVAVVGTNGAGKSTVLRVAAGVLPSGAGRVLLDGRDITQMSVVERVRAGLVLLPGGRGVFPSLSVAENLRLGVWSARRERAEAERRVDVVLERFPQLRDRVSQRASDLSGGEQQMLALSLALLCRPRVLMIDELSLGLDPKVVADLLDIVRRLNREGTSVLVVEQSLELATSVAARAVFLERGTVRYDGSTSTLARRTDLVRSIFFGKARPSLDGRRSRNGRVGGSLVVDRVSKHFGGIAALDAVSLKARRGEILGIIGANGAGKTTLLDVCSGFEACDDGRVVLDGDDITGTAPAGRAELGLGRIFQDARLFPNLTVAETIAVALERHVDVREPVASVLRVRATVRSERSVRERTVELIDLLGLERWGTSFVSELSTGTRRAVEFACMLAHEPSVVLLDEPTAGVAQAESEALAELIIDLHDQTGATFVIVEHDVPLLAAMADRMVCLHLGSVLAEGSPSAVLRDNAVAAAYLGTRGKRHRRTRAGAPAPR